MLLRHTLMIRHDVFDAAIRRLLAASFIIFAVISRAAATPRCHAFAATLYAMPPQQGVFAEIFQLLIFR